MHIAHPPLPALQNPLSQLGVLVMRNGVVERLTDISGSPEAQVRRLEGAALSESHTVTLCVQLTTMQLGCTPLVGDCSVLG